MKPPQAAIHLTYARLRGYKSRHMYSTLTHEKVIQKLCCRLCRRRTFVMSALRVARKFLSSSTSIVSSS
ncbi:hypothetical protein AG1IA_00807 [Rhizoctonia solani AG-1 IA]|uniref:Uncharacterized protein n=1 Tax=Thanatephorus cucumeris (strain AG1-IA) TaxID=983506 RepID=L8X4C9_THACA|nr:hypothetical protein AG1IA_00807 [Rhizoctonia solani AG-1 IA]